MTVPLRVLQVEDSESDAALVLRALVRSGYDVHAARVDALEDLRSALATADWDIVLADYRLPQFTAAEALRVLHESGKDLPLIIVSGTIGEALAADMMRAGARDYVMKGGLARLAPAVNRELREAVARREQRRAAQALRQREAQYRAAIEATPDGFLVVDGTGRIRDVNDAYLRRSGYAREELLAMDVAAIEARYSVAEIEQTLEEILRTGSARFETRHRARDGEAWDVDVSVAHAPDSGAFLYVFVRDITAQKRAAEEIRRFVAGSPAVIYALRVEDGILRHVWASERLEGLTGYRYADVWPAWWEEHLHPEDRERVLAAQAVPDWMGHEVIEYRLRHRDGRYLWIRDERQLMRDDAGRPVEVIGSWVDVTSRVELEQQYRQAQKMEAVGQLAGGIAHDFNNVLTVILSLGEMLADDEGLSEASRQDAAEIRLAAERASSLTRQLLAFSRKQLVELRVVDLNAILAGVEAMLRRLIGEDVLVTTLASGGPLPVRVDTGQVEQVIINLAVNARDAMPQGGRLVIAADQVIARGAEPGAPRDLTPGVYARLRVTDSGSGMTSDVIARAFEPFFTTKEVGKGTGLGLATVFGIVKQADGWIDVQSAPGEGTTFTIWLPLAEPVPAVTADAETSAGSQAGGECLLLVEDDDIVRRIARQALERQGYRVIEAAGGPQALAAFDAAAEPVRLLVTDIVMPEMSGRQVALRLQARDPHLKVLYMSGYIDDAVVRHGMAAEGAAILQKPFQGATLAYKVREVLDGRG
ncbi:MAG: response regulator [Vicinamibacterales bacterium]